MGSRRRARSSRNSPRRSGRGDLLRLAFLVLLALAAVGYSNGVGWIKRPIDAALSAFSTAVAERVTEPLREPPGVNNLLGQYT